MSRKKVDVEPVSNPQNKRRKWSGPILNKKLYTYQRRAVRKAMELKSLGLWMEQGTGKTLTALKYAGNLWKRGLINNLLILAPKAVLTVWRQEISDSLLIPYIVSDGKEAALSPLSFNDTLSITLLNYEAMRSLKGKGNKVKHFYDMVIADESHRIKNPNSIQSKQTYFLSRGSKYRIALSGTPKGNDDYDFFAQYRFINPQIFGFRTKDMKENYFEPCGFMGHDLRLRKDKKEEFYKKVNDNSFRITKKEALDLPPITETVIPVDLSKKAWKLYEAMENEHILELEDCNIKAELAITLVTKLQQICNGFIYNEDRKPVLFENKNAKIEVLKELLLDHQQEKIIIFCNYRQEIDLLVSSLKNYKILVYHGDSKVDDWKKFQSGKYDILITQIRKGGTGLNLQIASTVIFFSLSYSYIDLSQAKDRVHRNGQKNKVSVYYLLAKNTIERHIYRVLKNKGEGAKAILDDYRSIFEPQFD